MNFQVLIWSVLTLVCLVRPSIVIAAQTMETADITQLETCTYHGFMAMSCYDDPARQKKFKEKEGCMDYLHECLGGLIKNGCHYGLDSYAFKQVFLRVKRSFYSPTDCTAIDKDFSASYLFPNCTGANLVSEYSELFDWSAHIPIIVQECDDVEKWRREIFYTTNNVVNH